MLDGLKRLTGGTRGDRCVSELDSLLVAAREERAALTALLAQISMRAAKLSQLDAALQGVSAEAIAVTRRMAGISTAMDRLEERSALVTSLDERSHALAARLDEACQDMARIEAEHVVVQEYRHQVTEVSGELSVTRADAAALTERHEALDQAVERTTAAVHESLALADRLSTDLNVVRGACDAIGSEVVAAAGATAVLGADITALREQQPLIETALAKAQAVGDLAALVERIREDVAASGADVAGVHAAAGAVTTEVDGIRATVAHLTHEYGRLRDAASCLGEEAHTVGQGIQDVRRRLGEVEQIAGLRLSLDEERAQLLSARDDMAQLIVGVRGQCEASVAGTEEHTRALVDATQVDLRRLSEQIGGLEVALGQVTGHRATAEMLDRDVDALVAKVRSAEQQVLALMEQRAAVTELGAQIAGLARMLDGVRSDIRTLADRREMIETIAHRVSSIDLVVGQARQVFDALRVERGLAALAVQDLRQDRRLPGTLPAALPGGA